MSKFDESSQLPTDSMGFERTPTVEAPEATTLPGGRSARVDGALELSRGDRLGRHVILERLGSGGMGVVYAAYDPKLDRKIAIKLLRPGRSAGLREQERLLREARALAKLDDPRVVTVFDVGTTGPLVFVAMEYVPGRDLLAWVAETERSVGEILRVFDSAGRGLAAAHAAGLVHRDFKSNNVLVREDSQVKVLDFGLARVADDGGQVVLDTDLLDSGFETGIDVASPIDTELTTTGSILGTPAYMAPEQRRGEAIGPAADQFAFCVTLYRALYGQWPFDRRRQAAPRATEPADWQVIEPPEGSRVPARLFAIVARGLRFAPEDRYPSMEALLADMRHEPWFRRKGRLRIALGLVVATLFATGYLADRRARALPCRSAGELLAEVWNNPRALELSSALVGTEEPYARDAARVVRSSLDRYGERWVDMHREACEATHLRREQSEDLLDRRIACLDSRRREIGALVDLFILHPQETVLRSVEAVSALPPISACADTKTLMAPVALPDDEDSRRSVAEIRNRVAEAHAHQFVDRIDRGLDIAAEAIAAAEELDYWPITAEAHILRGFLSEETADTRKAVDSYEQALLAAQAGGHDRVAAEVFIRLVRLHAHQSADLEKARLYGRLAEGLLAHLGDTRRQRADLADHLGLLHLRSGELEQAVAEHRTALRARLENSRSLDGASIARTRLRLGNALKELGELGEARIELEKALALYEKILGSNHPEVAANLDRLGGLALDAGDPEAARDYYERAIAILEEAYGEEHVRVGDSLSNYGLVHLELGQAEEAAAVFARVEGIFRQAYGEDHPNLAALFNNIGSAASDQGRPAEALRYFERVHELHGKIFGPDHPNTGLSHFNLGTTELQLENPRAALGHFRQALAIWRERLPAGHYLIAHGLTGRARAFSALDRNQEAVEDLEAALRIWPEAGRDPVHAAETELVLCSALGSLGELERARVLCRSAHGVLVAASDKYQDSATQAREWLDQHGG